MIGWNLVRLCRPIQRKSFDAQPTAPAAQALSNGWGRRWLAVKRMGGAWLEYDFV